MNCILFKTPKIPIPQLSKTLRPFRTSARNRPLSDAYSGAERRPLNNDWFLARCDSRHLQFRSRIRATFDRGQRDWTQLVVERRTTHPTDIFFVNEYSRSGLR